MKDIDDVVTLLLPKSVTSCCEQTIPAERKININDSNKDFEYITLPDIYKFRFNYVHCKKLFSSEKFLFLFFSDKMLIIKLAEILFMKKTLITAILFFTVFSFMSKAQSFDWNIHGGLNLMKAKSGDSDLAFYYHAGVQAGVRITNIGLYGELNYSVHEDQYGGDPIPYLIPAALVKAYTLRFVFIELVSR